MSNDWTFGEAEAVCDRIMGAHMVTHDDLVGAMANAMRRIAALESQVRRSDLAERAKSTEQESLSQGPRP